MDQIEKYVTAGAWNAGRLIPTKKKKAVVAKSVPVSGTRAGKFIPATQLTTKERGAMSVRLQRKARFRKLEQKIQKSEDIFKSAPGFNAQMANATYNAIMKMDDDSAQVYVEHIMSNYIEDMIAKNLPYYQSLIDDSVAKRTEALKKVLVAKAADDPEGALPYAQALSEISKVDWDENLYRRDKGGRFATKVKPLPAGRVKPLDEKRAEMLGVQTPSNRSRARTDYDKLTPRQKAQYQSEYAQVAQFLEVARNSTTGNGGDLNVIYHFQGQGKTGKPGTQTWSVRGNGTKIPTDDLINPDQRLVGVEIKPESLSAGGTAYALTNSVGAPLGAGAVKTVNAFDRGGSKSFRNDWLAEGDSQNSNDRRYTRLGAAANLLGLGAAPGSKRQLAASAGQFVGSHGAEAEAVFGPSMRKTAYRYRGTEKKPDAHMKGTYERQLHATKMNSLDERNDDPNRPARYNLGQSKQVNLKGPAASQMAARRIMTERRDPEWRERRAARDVITRELKHKLPSKQLYGLQLQSGNTPPSEGVIIDRHGKVITQAIGYGDDHYLPFNLKNLKGLKGGEYVRTRSVGGLTSEDIYTGLLSGARQVTVVSRSGTFTMQFEEDFKGGRRYNDKAMRMTRRYEQILDAIQSEKVERRDAPAAIKQMIRTRIEEENPGEDRATLAQLTKEAVTEYKKNPEITDEDQQLIDRLAMYRYEKDPSKEAKQYVAEVTNEVMRNKGFMYQLNGRGYEDALMALEEQFPYYIKTSSNIESDDADIINLERDKGYVEPGRNRPTEALAGLYGRDENPKGTPGRPRGKFSASQADYQGGGGARQPKVEASTPNPDGPREGGENKGKLADAGRKVAGRRNKDEAAADLINSMRAGGAFNGSGHAFEKWTPEHTKAHLSTEEGRRDMDEFMTTWLPIVQTELMKSPQFREKLQAYQAAGAPKIGYSAAEAHVWRPTPPAFTEGPYNPNANPVAKQRALTVLDGQTPSLTGGGKLSQMSDEELKKEFDVLVDLRQVVTENPEITQMNGEAIAARKTVAAEVAGSANPAAIQALRLTPDRLTKRLENIHRIRSLKASGGSSVVAAGEPAPAQAVGGAAVTDGQKYVALASEVAEKLVHARETNTWTDKHEEIRNHLMDVDEGIRNNDLTGDDIIGAHDVLMDLARGL